jgi:Flp pilus assembly protein TadD
MTPHRSLAGSTHSKASASTPIVPADENWLGSAVAAAVIVVATAAVYANSWSGPFVFDDQASILHNASIRHLADLGAIFFPPGEGFTVDGRPVLNLSLAINYAISGTGTWSYHALNIVIHILAALTLFGITRRTLGGANGPGRTRAEPAKFGGNEATTLGLATALLWSLHPLQTESVTYVIQRAESLMGLFYLLTIYCFIRAVDAAAGRSAFRWYSLSWIACLLGMGSKEVMVSAPLIVLLYDGIFVSEGWRAALRRRGTYYVLLALTASVLLALALRTGSRGGTSGFGIDVTPWMYWQTQFQAVAHYLWLSFWPGTLIFDYGVQWTGGFAEVLPYALIGALLAVATGVGLWRRRATGFAGAFFFAILAPTSIVPGNRQTLAEHRMYLPLAAVIVVVVFGAYQLSAAVRRQRFFHQAALALVALPLAILTFGRNEIYRSELALYRDTVIKRPGNASAHTNLGNALRDARHFEEAITHYEEALRLRPNSPQVQYDLAGALSAAQRLPQAIDHYEAALRLKPDYAEAHNNLGIALARAGRDAEALGHLAEAVRLNPNYTEAHFNLGLVLVRTGRLTEAFAEYRETLRLDPSFDRAHEALGYALRLAGRDREAAEELETAARLRAAAPSMR